MSKAKVVLILAGLLFLVVLPLAGIGAGAYLWLNQLNGAAVTAAPTTVQNPVALNPTTAPPTAIAPAIAPPAAAPPAQADGDVMVSAPPVLADGTVAAFEDRLIDIYAAVNPSVVYILTDQGQGSGFVWDEAGHIVTNNHVIEGARQIQVGFADDSILTAQVIGRDPASDLAVLRVDRPASELAPITLGDSIQLAVGQLAIAIGNPFGQQGTMTVGIISALGRLQRAGDTTAFSMPDMIQTDAAINPGNSGGVLVDEAGQLIGVTSNIISATGSSAGIGFAIPAHLVGRVVPALISDGDYQHPYLGVSGATLTSESAVQLGLPADTRGTLLITVTDAGPASSAGLQGGARGDVIIAVDGVAVHNMDDLITHLARYGVVGDQVTLTIIRGGAVQDVPVTLGARPA